MINIHISPFFPDENFGGDYKNSLVYRLFKKNDEEAFTTEIKSAKVEIFDPNTKTYSVIKVVNKPSEVWKLAWYVFDYIASDADLKLKGQCNHTFVFYFYGGKYAHVCFSTDNILTEKEFNLFD